ncbi:MAG: hypothetical protein JWN76_1630 [Chitinophagaceae bacterium]|nr:hypothetical protein [Chitinophagaceae bacterium]
MHHTVLRKFLTALSILLLITLFTLLPAMVKAQRSLVVDSSQPGHRLIIAGPEYAKSHFYQTLWGKHYRKEWITPVNIPVMMLDTAAGGLKVSQAGGGKSSLSLRLKDKKDREYALRSVNKNFSKTIPDLLRGTFIENLVNDQASVGHPYAATTVPVMAAAAGVNHTEPKFVYVPKQPLLDSFNKKFGDQFFLFEQRPDGDWRDAPNLGAAKNYVATDKIVAELLKDNDNKVDQVFYVRSRLFDMMIGDWDRHEDQWRWAEYKSDGKTIYRPVPRDRDMTYSKFDGVLLKLGMSLGGIRNVQSFDYKIKDVKTFNFEERNMDRMFANEVTKAQWEEQARYIQQTVTDAVIERALTQTPPEITPFSSADIISKLKSRRDHLVDFADTYYNFISEEVEVEGSRGRDFFDVNRMSDDATAVNVYKISKSGKISSEPFYSRIFNTDETKELRLYGLEGEDAFHINGNVNKGIRIRIIGSADRDSIISNSTVHDGGKQLFIYDNPEDVINVNNTAVVHITSDTTINRFKYLGFTYDHKGFVPEILYNYPDRFYVGVGYDVTNNKWRKDPFANKQSVHLRYSISQKAFSVLYNGLFHEAVGKWDLLLMANYDQVVWTNFFGIGNDVPLVKKDLKFYHLSTKEWLGSIGLSRQMDDHSVTISANFRSAKILANDQHFIVKNYNNTDPALFDRKNFLGLNLDYTYAHLNDKIIPTSGTALSAGAAYIDNLTISSRSFGRIYGDLNFFIPLGAKFSLMLRGGGLAVAGNPEIYQYASIGGAPNLRGYFRDRFWGQSAVYNNNELRWITDLRTHILNGKFGLVGFFDDGRVWVKNDQSNTWHTAWGGGFLLAPFNKALFEVTYGITSETKPFQIKLLKAL